jgi:hypothetical protein
LARAPFLTTEIRDRAIGDRVGNGDVVRDERIRRPQLLEDAGAEPCVRVVQGHHDGQPPSRRDRDAQGGIVGVQQRDAIAHEDRVEFCASIPAREDLHGDAVPAQRLRRRPTALRADDDRIDAHGGKPARQLGDHRFEAAAIERAHLEHHAHFRRGVVAIGVLGGAHSRARV